MKFSKPLVSFFFGFVFALAVASGTMFYLFFWEKAAAPPPLKFDTSAANPEGTQINATLVIPPELRQKITGKMWAQVRIFTVFTQAGVSGLRLAAAANSLPPLLPQEKQELHFQLPNQIQLKDINPETRIMVKIRACSGERCEGTRFAVMDSRKFMAIPTDAKKLDLGTLVMSRAYPDTFENAPCLDKNVLLSGKIVPTRQFMENIPKGKELYLKVQAWSQAPSSWIFYQKISIAKEGTPFSVPNSGKYSGIVLPAILACDPGQSFDQCSHLAPDSVQDQRVTIPGNVYHLIGKGFQAAYCGQKDMVYYLHDYPEVAAGSEPVFMHKKDPSLPPEIIYGIF